MKLDKAYERTIRFYGKENPIRIDKNGYICLTDMVKFFPEKRIRSWLRLESTKEFIEIIKNNNLTRSDLSGLKPIISKSGKYYGGTYAHELLALDFATWLSPEFKLKIYQEYQKGTQRKKDWNIKRILVENNFKLLNENNA